MIDDCTNSRVVFVGAERVGLATLKRLFKTELDIAGVITASNDQRGDIADWVPFDDPVAGKETTYHKIADSNSDEFVDLIVELDPDVIFVISWSFIIPPEVINYPQNGVIGLHYSLLPERRGGAPLNWALIDGLQETGISLFYMEEELDTGDIIAQQRFSIQPDDTVKDLLDKIIELAPELVAEYAEDIVTGTAPRHEQDESEATYTDARSPDESEIVWDQSLRDLYNFIRALAPPYPSAFTVADESKLIIPSATYKNNKIKIEGYFTSNVDKFTERMTLMNTEFSPSEPDLLAADIRAGFLENPVKLNVKSHTVELSDADVRDGTLHVSGVIR